MIALFYTLSRHFFLSSYETTLKCTVSEIYWKPAFFQRITPKSIFGLICQVSWQCIVTLYVCQKVNNNKINWLLLYASCARIEINRDSIVIKLNEACIGQCLLYGVFSRQLYTYIHMDVVVRYDRLIYVYTILLCISAFTEEICAKQKKEG